MITRRIRLLTVMAAGTLAIGQTVSYGQGADTAALEEIIVTARKRAETLLEAPVAVSVLTGADIESRGVMSLADVALFTPGLTYFDAIQNQLGTPVIRGISQTNLNSPDRNVAVFYGGVYLSNLNATNVEILDLDRIEVVKGPQSALYGRNAFNGAVNYVPAAPTEQFTGKLSATIGSDARREARVVLSGALSETVRARFAASTNSFDGSWENTAEPDAGLGGYDTKNFSGTVEFTPNDRFLARVFAYRTEDIRDSSAMFIVPALNCGPTGRPLTAYCGDLPVRDSLAANPDALAFSREVALGALDIEYDFGRVRLRSQTAVYDAKTDNASDNALGVNDGRGNVFNIVNSAAPTVVLRQQNVPAFTGSGKGETETFTQELRLEGDMGERASWGVGWFYSNNEFTTRSRLAYDGRVLRLGERPQSDAFFFINLNPLTGVSQDPTRVMHELARFVGEDRQNAFFGLLEVKVTDRWTVGAELRRDKEDRERVNEVVGPQTFQQRTFEYTTWRAHVEHSLSDQQNLYASAAKGVISGYFNGQTDAVAGNIAVPAELQAYGPAENLTYELGWKSQWLNRRLSSELALFFIDYTGIQIPATPPAPLITNLVQNLGDATSKGVELAVNFKVNTNWQIGGTYSYTPTKLAKGTVDAGMLRYCGGNATTIPAAALGFCPSAEFRGRILPDVSGKPLPRSPNRLASVYAAFDQDLGGNWSMYARADGSYTSSANMLTIGLTTIPSRTIFNARAGFRNGPLDVAIWGRNIFDKKFVSTSVFQPPLTAGAPVFLPNVSLGERATYGVTAAYSFGKR
jgi:iron complex outermembrane receptor protein